MEKNSQTDAEINNFLYSIKDNDVRNFLLSICRIFNEKSLTRFFDLKALIELYNICTSYLKKEDTAFGEKFTLIANELNVRNFDPIQSFTFYWLFRRFLPLIDLSKIKYGRLVCNDLLTKELMRTYPIVTEYSKFNFINFTNSIEKKSAEVQIKSLKLAQKEFQLLIQTHNIKDNGFGTLCQKKIEYLELKLEEYPNNTINVGSGDIKLRSLDDDLSLSTENKTINPISEMLENFKNENRDLIEDDFNKQKIGDIHFAAKILGYKESYIRTLCRQGGKEGKEPLPHSRPSGKYLFKREELEAWRDRNFSAEKKAKMLAIGKKIHKK